MSETNHNLPIVMLELSSAGAVAFRQNTGSGWVGTGKPFKASRPITVTLQPGDMVLRGPVRPLHAGLTKGSSDIIGWLETVVTPEMIGQHIAVFVAAEVKAARKKATPEQKNFIDKVLEAGGIAGVARDATDAVRMIQAFHDRF